MKRHRHTPEQVVRKLAQGERTLNGGGDLAAVVCTLEISEATWNRWRSQYGGRHEGKPFLRLSKCFQLDPLDQNLCSPD